MVRRIMVKLALIALCCVLAAGISAAQSTVTGDGHVYDEFSGDPVNNAHVMATNQDSLMSYDDYTDGSGYYNIDLPIGNYHVMVTASGYDTWDTYTYISGPVTNDIEIASLGGGDGDGGGDGSGDDSFNPLSELDKYMWVAYLAVALAITVFVCILMTAIATTATFVRLGKVRKEIKEMSETLEELEERQAHSPQQQWQQPAYQQPAYQQQPQPGYQQPPAQQ